MLELCGFVGTIDRFFTKQLNYYIYYPELFFIQLQCKNIILFQDNIIIKSLL